MSRTLAQTRLVIITFNNQRAVTSNLVFIAQARFAVSLQAELPLEELRFVQESQVSHSQTNQFLTLANASVAWEYLIDDAKMGIFRAITTGWVGCWMVSQFCYCSLPDARADGGIGPRYAGPPEYPDSGGPAKAGPR